MIEKNIPMPILYNGRAGRGSIYPFMEMEVGDSIFFEGQRNGGPAYQSAKQAQRRAGDRKFVSRKEGNGLRIWRVS